MFPPLFNQSPQPFVLLTVNFLPVQYSLVIYKRGTLGDRWFKVLQSSPMCLTVLWWRKGSQRFTTLFILLFHMLKLHPPTFNAVHTGQPGQRIPAASHKTHSGLRDGVGVQLRTISNELPLLLVKPGEGTKAHIQANNGFRHWTKRSCFLICSMCQCLPQSARQMQPATSGEQFLTLFPLILENRNVHKSGKMSKMFNLSLDADTDWGAIRVNNKSHLYKAMRRMAHWT